MDSSHKLLESFAKQLEIVRAFIELKPNWFNPISIINTFRIKKQFKSDIAGLAHIAAESFVVEIRHALCDPNGAGEIDLPRLGKLKRVADVEKEQVSVVFIPDGKLIEGKKSFSGQSSAISYRSGLGVVEQDAKSYLECQERTDRKFRNVNFEYLLEGMCAAIAQNLLKSTVVDLETLGVFKPDLSFEPDEILMGSLRARISLSKEKNFEKFEFYRIDK